MIINEKNVNNKKWCVKTANVYILHIITNEFNSNIIYFSKKANRDKQDEIYKINNLIDILVF